MNNNDIKSIDSFKEWASSHFENRYRHFKENCPVYFDMVMEYIYLYYNKNSHFVARYKDIVRRRKEVISKCFKNNKGTKLKEFEDIVLKFTSSDYLFFVVEYCKAQNSRVWTMIVCNEHVFGECTELLLRPIQEEVGNDILKGEELKSRLMKDMQDINDRLVLFYSLLFPDTEGIDMAGLDSGRITPEKIASVGL